MNRMTELLERINYDLPGLKKAKMCYAQGDADGAMDAVIEHFRTRTTPKYLFTAKEMEQCSAGGRCHDNARCESMWARMKTELLYDRYDPEQLTVEQLKSLVWRYFMSYWNNRRICSANGGLPPMVKRSRFYAAQAMAA